MDFHSYPVDEQFCTIKFESFGLQSSQAQLHWLPDGMTINKNISLAQFYVSAHLVDEYTTDYYDIKYPGLELQLHLTRQIGYHIVQTYIPSTVFVVLGWMSLFIPSESVPGRVGMGMTTLLTLTAMFSAVRQNVPRVSYISYLDIWMLTCMIFVFSCIMEFIVVTALSKFGHKKHSERTPDLNYYQHQQRYTREQEHPAAPHYPQSRMPAYKGKSFAATNRHISSQLYQGPPADMEYDSVLAPIDRWEWDDKHYSDLVNRLQYDEDRHLSPYVSNFC